MNLPSTRSYHAWQRDCDVFLRLWKSELAPYLIEPVVILTAMGMGLGFFIGRVGEKSYLEFLAPGIAASYAMFSAAFECTYASYIRMEMQKTFDAIIATPMNIEDVIAGEIFWAATRSAMTASAIVLVSLAFGAVSSPFVALVPLLAILEGVMIGSLSLFFTSVAPTINSFNYFFTLFITPMYFFSGVFFPISALPHALQVVAQYSPLTPVVNLSRALFSGEFTIGLVQGLAFILAITLLFFTLSLIGMRRRLIK